MCWYAVPLAIGTASGIAGKRIIVPSGCALVVCRFATSLPPQHFFRRQCEIAACKADSNGATPR
jgi:hypothetical protein